MERVLDILRILPYEAFVGMVALLGVAILFGIRSIEALRGSLLGGPRRVVLDERVARLHNQALLKGYFLFKNASGLPRMVVQSVIHTGALVALHAIRNIERVLKRVLDTVRGRRELTTDLPPSPFIATILPKRKVQNPVPKEGQQLS